VADVPFWQEPLLLSAAMDDEYLAGFDFGVHDLLYGQLRHFRYLFAYIIPGNASNQYQMARQVAIIEPGGWFNGHIHGRICCTYMSIKFYKSI